MFCKPLTSKPVTMLKYAIDSKKKLVNLLFFLVIESSASFFTPKQSSEKLTYVLYVASEESQVPIEFLLAKGKKVVYFPFQFDSLLVGPTEEAYHEVFPVSGGKRIEYFRKLYLAELPNRFQQLGLSRLADYPVFKIDVRMMYRLGSMPNQYNLFDLKEVYQDNKSANIRLSLILATSVILSSVLIVFFFYRFRLKRILK